MIPWERFETPLDAYEHTQRQFRDGLSPWWFRDSMINGESCPWRKTDLEFSTWWASISEPGKAQEGVHIPVRR